MYDINHVYGLDIETDNRDGNGLNPQKAAITEVALVTAEKSYVFADANEKTLLKDLVEAVSDLPSGLIVDWNGAFFDQPYIHDRLVLNGLRHLAGQILLHAQDGLEPKYQYLPGHTTAYNAQWPARHSRHAHLDISFAYKTFAASFGTHVTDAGATRPVVPWSLKPVLRAAGFAPVELDRTNLHRYTPEEVRAYVLSDASGARDLALRTLGLS